jgi:SAM-dependent methyltransferase
MQNKINTWANTQTEEDAMYGDHYYLWCQMIEHMQENNLLGKSVLDFGCNQGGFLRVLYDTKPFKSGVGVDLASNSIDKANSLSDNRPITYHDPEYPITNSLNFDLAFSHEVLYLLKDLDEHASYIKNVLTTDGVYYAAIGCHTENPSWDHWVSLISDYSNIQVQNYSLDDYAQAFFDHGFEVSARAFNYSGFIPIKNDNSYFPKIKDTIDYHNIVKTLFRFKRRSS